MKKVFLINPLSYDTRYNRFPLGIGYLAASIQSVCDVKVFDLIDHNEYKKLIASLFQENVDIIGISLTSLNIENVHSLIRELKLIKPGAIIVLGGPQATAQPYKTLKLDIGIDYVIIGQGEEALRELVIALSAGKTRVNIGQVLDRATLNSNDAMRTDIMECMLIDGSKYDYPMRYLPIKPKTIQQKYNLHYRPGSILTARGCANHCSFCTVSLGKRISYAPVERVIDEIAFLHEEYGVTELLINDADFLAYTSRAIELIKVIKQLGYIKRICLNACVASIIKIERELDLLLNGLEWEFEVGIESVCDTQLLRYNKKAKADQNYRALDILYNRKKKHNIKIAIDMILFDPYSEWREFEPFISFFEQYHLNTSAYEDMVDSIVYLFPGTKIRDQAIRDGLAEDSLGSTAFRFKNEDVGRLYGCIRFFCDFVMPKVKKMRKMINDKIFYENLPEDRIRLFQLEKKYDSILFDFFKELYYCFGDQDKMNISVDKFMDEVQFNLKKLEDGC